MRRLFISADIEGCAGVASQDALGPDRFEWPAARHWMTNEVASAARVALAAGYDEVIVADGHGNAQNILPDGLPDRVRLVRSWPRPLLQMQGVEADGVEACFFLGYHNGSMGTGGGLAHTYSGMTLRDVRLNGVSVSEGYLNAALAGEFGRPVVLVSGDAETAADAKRYAPRAVTCVVKDSIGNRAASAVTPNESVRMIGRAAEAALGLEWAAPFVVPAPHVLEVDLTARVTAELLSYLPGIELAGPFTVRATFDSVAAIMRFLAFAILYSPSGVIKL